MHILLTDRLICPRCGPGFGLILIADLMEDRRVIEGSLGCPNCRERFPVEEGFGDLRPPPRSAVPGDPDAGGVAPATPPGSPNPPGSPSATEVAALLGLTEGGGSVALIGELAGQASDLARLVPGVEFIGIAAGLRGWEEEEGVSRMTAGACLPFGSGSLRGVGFRGGAGSSVAGGPFEAGGPEAGGPEAGRPSLAAELVRVVAPTGRIAVWGRVKKWEHLLRSEGLEVLAQDESAVVLAPRA